MRLAARLYALESKAPADDGPLVLLITFVEGIEGRHGRRTDWDAWMPEVVVDQERHPVQEGESAEAAVHRVIAARTTPPRVVIARPGNVASSYGSAS